MAAPPITIGPFDNVPAPGSPIRSNWAQEISQYALDLAYRPRFRSAVGLAPGGGGVVLSGGAVVVTGDCYYDGIDSYCLLIGQVSISVAGPPCNMAIELRRQGTVIATRYAQVDGTGTVLHTATVALLTRASTGPAGNFNLSAFISSGSSVQTIPGDCGLTIVQVADIAVS